MQTPHALCRLTLSWGEGGRAALRGDLPAVPAAPVVRAPQAPPVRLLLQTTRTTTVAMRGLVRLRGRAPPPPLIRPPTVEDGNDAYYKVQCPLCRTHTCVRCATAWHDDTTCLIAQAATTDKDGSAALRALAASEAWRPCPRCGQMIEKTDGCAYVHHAACGAGFCFHCGAEYQQQQGHGRGRARTPHGTPECDCGLFGERAPRRR